MSVPAYAYIARIEVDGEIYGRVVVDSASDPRPRWTVPVAIGNSHWFIDADVIVEDRLCPTCHEIHSGLRPLGHDGVCGGDA